METIIAILVIIGLLFVAARFVIKNKEQISEIVGGAIGCGIIGPIAAAFLADLVGVESVNIGAIALVSGTLGLIVMLVDGGKSKKKGPITKQLISGKNYKNLPKLEDPAGYVYLLKDVSHTGQYKIGRTNHPATRLGNFGVKLPIETTPILILKTNNAKTLENKLHKQYSSYRRLGEWFELTDDQVSKIRQI